MRRCSVCRKVGHTKRTCTGVDPVKMDIQEEIITPEEFLDTQEIEPPKPVTIKEKPIFVRVVNEAKHSPHVLSVTKKENPDAWKLMPVFLEKKDAVPAKRVAVDLAAAVREANANEKERQNKVSAYAFFADLPKLQKPFFSWKKREAKKRIKKEKQASAPSSTRFSEWVQQAIHRPAMVGTVAMLILFLAIPYPAFAYYQKLQHTSASVLEASTNGFLALQSSTVAALHSDISSAQQNLNRALESFAQAESVLEQEHQAVLSIASFLPLVGTQIESRRHLLSAGHHVALGNTYLLKGIQEIEGQKNLALTDRFYRLREHFHFALPQYRQALADLAAVNEGVVPDEFVQSFRDFKLLFAAFVNDTEDMIAFVDSLETIFGSDDFKRYLVVFQNNRELRPTGGFMGSFAVVDIQKGKIMNLSVPPGGTYDLQGQLSERVRPPTPLLLTNDRWEFQDANWWPDFPVSAQKMAWFYQYGRGSTVDGVIAINANVFEEVLSVLGPVESAEHDVVLDAETALDALQYKVEVDYDKEANTPKAIIGDVLEQTMAQMQQGTSADALKLLVALHGSLETKDIQAYFTDPDVQNQVREFGWSGELVAQDAQQDYLMVVNTNIQGQKTDAKIDQEIEHQAEVAADGSVTDTVVVRRTHTGTVGEMFSGRANISYVRMYVPEGAELIDAGGFTHLEEQAFRAPDTYAKIDLDLERNEKYRRFDEKTGIEMYESFGKTVFAGWVVTDPGSTSEVFLTYRLPFQIDMHQDPKTTPQKWQNAFFDTEAKDASRYSLVVQKQSGIESTFSSTVIYDPQWRPVWKSREDIDLALNGGIFHTALQHDEIYGIVMEKQ